MANPELASSAISVAAGGSATVYVGVFAVATAAGHAVAGAAVRAAGEAARAVVTAAEALAARLEDLGLALVAGGLVAALVAAFFGNFGSAVGIAQRWTVAA